MEVDQDMWDRAVKSAKNRVEEYRRQFGGVKEIVDEPEYEREAPIKVVFSKDGGGSEELLADVLAATTVIFEVTFNSPGIQTAGGIRKKC